MKEESLIAKRLVCQYVQLHGGRPADMALNKALLSSCSGAYQSYKAALEARRQSQKRKHVPIREREKVQSWAR
ncbi:hypothetical protein RRG08_003065 [Elysia crispata]|uniref:Uncharacterized protein n=1 Tax=Elysia crispata TaxID=231223 RepID=A0AAE1B734_9GAST|nr:hypothetical protein RRG08_003065 [Elysia crispata]